MILSLGYFVLSTRMHERYVFNAVVLATPLIFYRQRYLYAAIALSLTLLGNLLYSFDYLHVLDDHVTGVDPTDLLPFLSRPAAVLNVATFFYLGYVYLGAGSDALQGLDLGRVLAGAGARVRRWFAPLEGTAPMTPRDWVLAASLGVSSFVLTFVDYTWPSEKIFDEIYYARAGEEYLTHKEIFEFTHPPLTKLWITLSMILFGGMHGGGDTAAGWRFLNLVVGALMVVVLYCFAKRLFGSTFFATVAAGLLILRRFPLRAVAHRDARNHRRVLLAAHALRVLPLLDREPSPRRARASRRARGPRTPWQAAAAALLAAIFAALVAHGQSRGGIRGQLPVRRERRVSRGARARAALSQSAYRRVVRRRLARARRRARNARRRPCPSPGLARRADSRRPSTRPGSCNVRRAACASRTRAAGAATYATDDGTAAFAPDGTMRAGDATIDGARDGRTWLWLLALAAGCLAREQVERPLRFLRRVGPHARGRVAAVLGAALARDRPFGNGSRGRRAGAIRSAFRSTSSWRRCSSSAARSIRCATFRTSCSGHSLGDLVGLQQQMFGYHYDLKATHPYGSKWWQWPFILRPISYYYHDWRTGAATQDPTACCVAEIIAIPNPAVWWFGLVSIPVDRVARLSRTQQGLRAAGLRVLPAVVAVGELAARRVRIPLLSEFGRHLSRECGRAAARLALRRDALRPRRRRGTRRVAAVGRRSVSRARGRPVRLFLSHPRGLARPLERLGRPHVALVDAQPMGLICQGL